jgi:uncharacterized protein YdeI (YjbR/CyaY-like superfamily)
MAPSRAVDIPTMGFVTPRHWERWLGSNHGSSPGIWMRIAKQGSDDTSVTYQQALEVALCYGWIDGQKAGLDDRAWLQKFTPRRRGSRWSKINREKAEALIAEGRMKPAGQSEVDRAKKDGRWDAAYEGSRRAAVPEDLARALESNPTARSFFETLDSRNRYAVLYRIHDAKKPETRARRVAQFVEMLEEGRTIHD